ncbi:terminase small subunit [Enterococcus wangshanyuanii]|uniref:Terminase n=1 Tax=Enterococcus wangshanyuanii TaxID=2005703 RepID=A0ABQ1PJN5_9ENTE|nr:terminase small subunit [Enterococcus wangshanyuanii]GGC98149.1 terminase [Enterococcus wangshanyuanii]
MAGNIKEPSKKTKEQYDLFIDSYLQSFNATQSAIAAGYSKKTARQQGHRLLTNVYIKEKIKIEMKRLRERMKDEGLRSFAMLIGIAIDTEEKIQKHNEAEVEIIRINALIDEISLELSELGHQRAGVQRAADAIDGRKADLKERKRGLLAHVENLDAESFELEKERRKLFNERSKHELYYLQVRDWEKLQSLKKSIFQDILDRGGFKAIDEIKHSGAVNVGNPLDGLTEEELRRLANGP